MSNSSHHTARVGGGTSPFFAWFSGPFCAGGSTGGTGGTVSGHVQPGPAVIFAFLINGKAQALVEAPCRHIGRKEIQNDGCSPWQAPHSLNQRLHGLTTVALVLRVRLHHHAHNPQFAP